jgi:hypothetical protein
VIAKADRLDEESIAISVLVSLSLMAGIFSSIVPVFLKRTSQRQNFRKP